MGETKKLIEVEIPLDDINKESSREKSLRHGHPSTLHLWWARRPCSAARAVLFSQLVDDPSSHPELFPTKDLQDKERKRLFRIMKRLVVWENSLDDGLLGEAKKEIKKYVSHSDGLHVLDPFSGGGTIPLEAQRLGLFPIAHDLNPVALTIEKAMLDLPCRFQGLPPVNPKDHQSTKEYDSSTRAYGLAKDIKYYANLLKEKTFKEVSKNYPLEEVYFGTARTKLTPIAYIWSRTIPCPNPGCRKQMPLVKSFVLSSVKGHEAYWQPVLQGNGDWKPEVFKGTLPKDLIESTIGKERITCPFCHEISKFDYLLNNPSLVKERLAVVVLDSKNGRIYKNPADNQVIVSNVKRPLVYPTAPLAHDSHVAPGYGYKDFSEMYSNRQLFVLTKFSSYLKEVSQDALNDALRSGMKKGNNLEEGGRGALAYSQAIKVYLAFVIDKLADYNNKCCSWHNSRQQMRDVFGRQAIARTYDYCESNPFSGKSGSFDSMVDWVSEAVGALPCGKQGEVEQFDATQIFKKENVTISTDPPYYDNIDYSDLSDFFYVWLKWNLKDVFPKLYRGTITPKADELIANATRTGSKKKAETFFENGMLNACKAMMSVTRDDLPITIYYAYKASTGSVKDGNYQSSGWETMLSSLIKAGFKITGTWPVRTEMKARLLGYETNALASSIVIVCRKRNSDAESIGRAEFGNRLHEELNRKLAFFRETNLAPVDLQQAIIGPGMEIYSRYSEVLKADGTPMSVHEALNMINQEVNSILNKDNAGLDSISQFCLFIYKNYGNGSFKYGDVQSFMTTRNISLDDLKKRGILIDEKGIIRLSFDPKEDFKGSSDRSIWEVAMQIVAGYEKESNAGAAKVLGELNDDSKAGQAKALLYSLFQIATAKGLSSDALRFNNPVTTWEEIRQEAPKKKKKESQMTLEEFMK